MKRTLLVSVALALAVFPLRAHAQQTPLPTLPPPATGSAPSSLNPPANPLATPTAPATPTATPTPTATATATATPTATFDVTSAPPTFTQVSAPYVNSDAPVPPPIVMTGPGAFTHDGFYLRLSSGIGALAIGGSGPTGSARLSGFASSTLLAIGGTPSRGFVVGGAVSARTLSGAHTSGVDADATSIQSSALGVFVDWFPSEHRGWHVGGLLGLGTLRIQSVSESDQINLSFAGQAFGGYDFWIGPEWSLGIQGVLGFSTQSPMRDGDQNDTGYSLGSLSGAIEGTLLFH